MSQHSSGDPHPAKDGLCPEQSCQMLNHLPRVEGKAHIPFLSLEQSPQLGFLPGGDQHQGGTQPPRSHCSWEQPPAGPGHGTQTPPGVFCSSQDTQWPRASAYPLPSPRALRSALGPQCPKTFTEPYKQRAINVHFWERSPKKHLPGSQHMHSSFFPKKLQLRRKPQQGRGAEAGRPQPDPSAAQALQTCMHITPAPSLLPPFELTVPKKVLVCF